MKSFFKRLRKKEDGAALIIEMTLVFPLVLFVMAVLIYMSCYILQGVTIYNNAQRIAVEATREIAMPGYEKLHISANERIYVKADFNTLPSGEQIKTMLLEHKPYRYWSGNPLGSNAGGLETSLKKLVENSSILANSNVDCDIKTTSNIIGQQVIVQVTKHVPAPGVIRFFGITDNLDIHVTAVAIVSDPAEFIRNTDMVFDLIDFMFDKIKIKGKSVNEQISEYKQKFDSVKTKLGIKS